MKQYFRNMGVMIGQSTIQRLLDMFTTIVLARVLGSANLGIYSIVVNTGNSAYGLVRMGIDAAIHVHTAEHHSDAETRNAKGQMLGAGLILLSGAGIIGAMICLMLAQWIATEIYGLPEIVQWIRLAAILVFFQCLSQFCYAGLAGFHRFKEYAKVMILSSILKVLSASIASWLWGLTGALYALLIVQGFTTYFLWRQVVTALSLDEVILRFVHFGRSVRSLISTGLPFYGAGLLAIPVSYYLQGDLGRTIGLDALGQLRVIVSITAIISFLPTSIAAVMVSHLARESGTDYASFVEKTMANLKFVWISVLFSGVATFSIMPILIDMLFGGYYAGAAVPAAVALISAVLACVLGVVSNAALSRKRLQVTFLYSFLHAATFLAIGILVIPRMGLTGYFFAEGVGIGGALVFVWFWSRKWRQRNDATPYWILPMGTLTLYAIFAFFSPVWLGHSSHNWWIGLVGLIFFAVVIYHLVLDNLEREVFKSKILFASRP